MLPLDTLTAMSLFALATSATPGPVNILSAMTGARFGAAQSLPFVLGATTCFVAILLGIGGGMQVTLGWIDTMRLPIALAGAAYLLYLAYRIARSDGRVHIAPQSDRFDRPSFLSGVVTQGLNPKAWLVSLSAISTFILPLPEHGGSTVIFSVLFFVICAASLFAWALVGQQIAHASGGFRQFNRVMAATLGLSILWMVYDAVQ